jgi:Lar family restriction alleviation protein
MDKKEDIILTDGDILNGGYITGELKPCPFCNSKPISHGKRNEKTLNVVYTVSCTNMYCNAEVFACIGPNAEESRKAAIEQWNKRQEISGRWLSEKPSFQDECIFITATNIGGQWNYYSWAMVWTGGIGDRYLALCNLDGEEWGPLEDLKADFYCIISSLSEVSK